MEASPPKGRSAAPQQAGLSPQHEQELIDLLRRFNAGPRSGTRLHFDQPYGKSAAAPAKS
ncbi:MAG: hypothetical protein V4582_21565 [Pseudomonadota bacterium]